MYKLKDQELQKTLDELTHGDFSRQIRWVNPPEEGDVICVSFGKRVNKLILGTPFESRQFTARFVTSEVEEIQEYDPKEWNRFPEIIPPSEVDMRVELEDGRGFQAWWDGENWRTGYHHYSLDRVVEGVKRFRPLED